MHASRVLQKWLASSLCVLDARNVRTLLQTVEACLAGRRLVMMELARHWPGAMKVAAPLKRLDRLLGNRSVHAARSRLYQAAIVPLLHMPEPVLVVDWSELKRDGRWHLLRAGVVLRGRTLTVYEEVHPQQHLNSRSVHTAFLRRLKALLPACARPIVVTDAGFTVPWFRQVDALGWQWLGRVRGHVGLRTDRGGEPYRPVRALHDQATGTAKRLGAFFLTAYQPLRCQIVVVRPPRRGRRQRLRNGATASGGHPQKMMRAAREPWVLAHSPSLSRSPRQIVRLYAQRMQIEASFRDLKSHRYGCAFEDTQTRSAERLEVLLLIHLLATLMAWLAAVSTTALHEQRFRISLLRRGWELLRRRQPFPERSPPASFRQLARMLHVAAAA